MGRLGNAMVMTASLVALAVAGLISLSEAAPGAQQDTARLQVIGQSPVPLAFVEKRGQVDPRVEFHLSAGFFRNGATTSSHLHDL